MGSFAENFYNKILQKTENITFEEYLILRALNLIDPKKVHYLGPDLNKPGDFGGFSVDLDIPKYNYEIFFPQKG